MTCLFPRQAGRLLQIPPERINLWINSQCQLPHHAAALLGLFFHFLGHLLGPLIVWLVKRGDSPEVDAHGKESLNFQISMLIYDAIAAILCIVLIGIPILIALWVLNTVLVIIASIQASEGKFYRYPITIRLIK